VWAVAFIFEYWGLSSRPMPCGHWVSDDDQQWNLFGRLVAGRLALGDSILLPTASGVPFRGYVARFAESFTEWLGLPFYDYLTPAMMPEAFCLCVGGNPGEHVILCPGVARSADA
jgi:hypothetical protein